MKRKNKQKWAHLVTYGQNLCVIISSKTKAHDAPTSIYHVFRNSSEANFAFQLHNEFKSTDAIVSIEIENLHKLLNGDADACPKDIKKETIERGGRFESVSCLNVNGALIEEHIFTKKEKTVTGYFNNLKEATACFLFGTGKAKPFDKIENAQVEEKVSHEPVATDSTPSLPLSDVNDLEPRKNEVITGDSIEAFLSWSAGISHNSTRPSGASTYEELKPNGSSEPFFQESPPSHRIRNLVLAIAEFGGAQIGFYIAGRQFYSAPLEPPFHLKANPLNRYDKFAIEVRNRHGNIIGHVPRSITKATFAYAILTRYVVEVDVDTSVFYAAARIDLKKMSNYERIDQHV